MRIGVAGSGMTAALAALVMAASVPWNDAAAQSEKASRMIVKPEFDPASEVASQSVSDTEHGLIVSRLTAMRERLAAAALTGPPSDATEGTFVPATEISGLTKAVEGALVLGRNVQNPRAEDTGNSAVQSPAAAGWKKKILYSGNFKHLERSLDHGGTFQKLNVPAGPADAPVPCCNNDIVIDSAGTAYHSMLYTNTAVTNGVVRITVRPQAQNFAVACAYVYDPAGTSNNIIPDNPQIRLTKNYLYLSANAIGAGGGFSAMVRYDLTKMRNCNPVTAEVYTQPWGSLGQRVWAPAEGAMAIARMMWMHHETASRIRVFDWPDTAAEVTSFTVSVEATSFANPDCRGGASNRDFIEKSTSWSIAGYTTRCALAAGSERPLGAVLACYWQSSRMAGYPNAHIRSAHIDIASKTVVEQPKIWSPTACYGYPSVTSSQSGALGFSVAYGGLHGGNGPPLKGAVGVSDTTYGTNFGVAADGIAMRNDGQYGNYLTVHRHDGCPQWFTATSYAWEVRPGDTPDDVNARWVEFGRQDFQPCWNVVQ